MPKPRINPNRRTYTLTEADLKKIVKAATDKATETAIKLSSAIFFTVLCDKEQADKEIMQRVWLEVENLSDSIAKKYVTVHDLIKTLSDEYDIIL